MGTRTREALATEASKLADEYHFVLYHAHLYVPVPRDTRVLTTGDIPVQDRMWQLLSTEDLQRMANQLQGVLFQNPSELANYVFMLRQRSIRVEGDVDSVLIDTPDGLRCLTGTGEIIEPTGDFVPNLLGPTLVTDEDHKDRVWKVLLDWLGDETTAHSLLYHLATSLTPGWSAKKLVLLLGEGRNGKSTLLKMLVQVLGRENVSDVTRQQMATREPAIVGVNGKLANIVFDASSEYIKDSSTEKTLLVGEPVGVRLLYESVNTEVRTNALFLEGMNREPLTRDKSNAIQRRITRFHFRNTYPEDTAFERLMLGPESLGAFLALLLEHLVQPGEEALKLAPSAASYDLQVDQLVVNSSSFEYLQDMVTKDPKNAERILNLEPTALRDNMMAWWLTNTRQNDATPAQMMQRLREIVVIDRRSVRRGGKVIKENYIKEWTPDAARLVARLTEEGEPDAAAATSGTGVVDGDDSVHPG